MRVLTTLRSSLQWQPCRSQSRLEFCCNLQTHSISWHGGKIELCTRICQSWWTNRSSSSLDRATLPQIVDAVQLVSKCWDGAQGSSCNFACYRPPWLELACSCGDQECGAEGQRSNGCELDRSTHEDSQRITTANGNKFTFEQGVHPPNHDSWVGGESLEVGCVCAISAEQQDGRYLHKYKEWMRKHHTHTAAAHLAVKLRSGCEVILKEDCHSSHCKRSMKSCNSCRCQRRT